MGGVRDRLFELADGRYREFQAGLLPTVDKARIIGVKTPQLRAFAKNTDATEAAEFISQLPHYYYEENNLHAFILERERDFNRLIEQTDRFLPYIDNWATCDCFSPPLFKKKQDELLPHVLRWIYGKGAYTVRFAIVTLMSCFLDDRFSPEYLELIKNINRDDYYIMMAKAWFFATALAKQPQATLPYIEKRLLDEKTRIKAIQKAIESKRIPDDMKLYLRQMRR